MKKILFLLFAAAAFAACNDDDGAPKIRYASTNDGIVNGHLQGINMFFYGRAVATDDTGDAYTDDEALFEFAGGPSGDSEYFSLYMHKTRFARKEGSRSRIYFSAFSVAPPLPTRRPSGSGRTAKTVRFGSIPFSRRASSCRRNASACASLEAVRTT